MKHYGSQWALLTAPLTVRCCQRGFRCCAFRQLRPVRYFLILIYDVAAPGHPNHRFLTEISASSLLIASSFLSLSCCPVVLLKIVCVSDSSDRSSVLLLLLVTREGMPSLIYEVRGDQTNSMERAVQAFQVEYVDWKKQISVVSVIARELSHRGKMTRHLPHSLSLSDDTNRAGRR